ncbi:hypothetical protein M0812_07154 [Anaeramoeba flamelloides]|uniref:Phosphatidic acid phosphatase type 2/haloperoxidase domain-containing protein n=1 Tax=Anaeramoeba flamelloides TaxID=1746091 RepID=A0AAV8AAR2_9EUKA|nr:hypothetical protein M0812_07154 [Anaeramoeba flamelloides]
MAKKQISESEIEIMTVSSEPETLSLLNSKQHSDLLGQRPTNYRHLQKIKKEFKSQAKKHLDRRFCYQIPESFEIRFIKYDIKILQFIQKWDNKFLDYLALFITLVTTIEAGIIASPVLFLLGQDSIAIELTYIILMYGLISQIPKRFLWRTRPFMRGYSKQKRKDYTSSLPSRAVSGAIVYMYLIDHAISLYKYHDKVQLTGWIILSSLIFALLATWSRCYFGVHYPSDCLLGLIQGIVICLFGFLIYRSDIIGCKSCSDKACYTKLPNKEITFSHLERADWVLFAISSVVSIVLMLLSIVKPVEWWRKSHFFFGTIIAGIVFHLVFLCPDKKLRKNPTSLPPPPPPNKWYFWLISIGQLAFVIEKKKKNERCGEGRIILTVPEWHNWNTLSTFKDISS